MQQEMLDVWRRRIWRLTAVIWCVFVSYLFATTSWAYTLEVEQATQTAWKNQNLNEAEYNQNFSTNPYTFATTANVATKFAFLMKNEGGSDCTGTSLVASYRYCVDATCSTGEQAYANTSASATTGLAAGATAWVEYEITSGPQIRYITRLKPNTPSGGTNCGSLHQGLAGSDLFNGTAGNPSQTYIGNATTDDIAFRVYSGSADPRISPTVTIQKPVDSVEYGSVTVPYVFATDVCVVDYPDEVPYLTYQLEKWDGDSWEDYALTSLGAWSGYTVDNDCDSGLAYAWGAVPDLYLPNALTAGAYRISAAARFPENSYGSYSGWTEFDVVVQAGSGGGVGSTGGVWTRDDTSEVSITEIIDFGTASCDFTDGFFQGLWDCMTDFIGFLFFPSSASLRGVVNLVGLNTDVWPISYISVPLLAIDAGYTAGYADGCDEGESTVDFGTGAFEGAEFDFCEQVNDVGAYVGEYVWYIIAVLLTVLGILLYAAMISSRI